MTAKITIEFNESFIEIAKLESGYTNSEELAAFLKGIFISQYEEEDVKHFIKNLTVEIK